MKLYSGPLSLFTAKVRIALAEKGLAYERVEVDWNSRDRYLPHHLEVAALNPKGQVPVLVDGDVVVCDSTLILIHLEEAHAGTPLLPEGAAGRARARQFEAWADEIVFPAVWGVIEETFYPAAPEGRDAARLEAAQARLAQHHATLEKELAGRTWLCDGAFSIADIGVMVFLGAAASMGVPPSQEHVHLAAWMQRCGERASIQDEFAEMAAFSQAALAG
ncbi:MAG: glutathione S-transferase family protein [Deltaproteobacteria bacterium]|nr:glutathione S-transferase family protein [Deltaproteobacteria bacterium]MBW2394300.1 glutathione S-transferase family protein [Deltaproteobacteria bacterium]